MVLYRDPAAPLRRDVQHRHEQAEEQQRGPEVPLQDEDETGEPPGEEDRAEIPRARLTTQAVVAAYFGQETEIPA